MQTLEKKLEIISEMKKGKSVRCVSGLHEVPQSTVGYRLKSMCLPRKGML